MSRLVLPADPEPRRAAVRAHLTDVFGDGCGMGKEHALCARFLAAYVPGAITSRQLAMALAELHASRGDVPALLAVTRQAIALGAMRRHFELRTPFAPFLEHAAFAEVLATAP